MLLYLDNQQLAINKEIYSFDDAQIMLEDGKEILLQGIADVNFTEIDDSFNHAYGTETTTTYEVNEVFINVVTIYDSGSIKITLNECKALIECDIRSQSINTNI